MDISLKSGVLAVLAALALAAPVFAQTQTETESPSLGNGQGLSVKYHWIPETAYGKRATISGTVTPGGWKVTLFLRAAGESRYHAAGSVTLGSGAHKFTLRTGKLTRTTRFKLGFNKGTTHATGGVSTIRVGAKVAVGTSGYNPDGSLPLTVFVSPNQPSGSRVRVFGVDSGGVRRTIATARLTRSGARSLADVTVPNADSYPRLEISFLGSSTNRATVLVLTTPSSSG